MAKMTVYHGGYISVENPQVRIGRNTKDFGTGVLLYRYQGTGSEMGKTLRYKVVSIYEVRLNLDLNIKEFQEMTEEWLDFIIDCRSGKSHNYDIVIGAMADDQIYNYISDYIEELLQGINFGVWQNSNIRHIRLIFVRKKALKCLEYRGFEEGCVMQDNIGRESSKDNDLFFHAV